MDKSRNTRFNYIDIARGIGLFFVILGHLIKFNSIYFNWIFSFHIPLFFIISGMCYELKKQPDFITYIKKKSKSLLIPYLVFLIFGFIISYIIPIWRDSAISEEAFRMAFYLTQPELFHVGQIWFLVALFMSSILLYLVDNYIINKNKNIKWKNIFNIILIIFFICIALLTRYISLPWKINTALMGTAFMLFGSFIKRNNFIEKIKSKKYISLIILIFLSIINYILGPLLNGYVNICDCVYGNVFYYFIAAISGSVCILIISSIISRNKLLEYYGRNSLFMFSIHSMFLYLTEFILFKIYKTKYYIMVNIPINICIVSAIIIFILLGFITLIYNKIIKKQ